MWCIRLRSILLELYHLGINVNRVARRWAHFPANPERQPRAFPGICGDVNCNRVPDSGDGCSFDTPREQCFQDKA